MAPNADLPMCENASGRKTADLGPPSDQLSFPSVWREEMLSLPCKRFPAEMPCCIQIALKDGRALNIEKQDYKG